MLNFLSQYFTVLEQNDNSFAIFIVDNPLAAKVFIVF